MFRQSDVPFISALESIRRGDCTQEHIRFFESCGSALKQKENIAILPTNLFPMKKEVEQTNEVEFNKLKSKPYAFKAVGFFLLLFFDSCRMMTDSTDD